jgi:hypothetical protein
MMFWDLFSFSEERVEYLRFDTNRDLSIHL